MLIYIVTYLVITILKALPIYENGKTKPLKEKKCHV